MSSSKRLSSNPNSFVGSNEIISCNFSTTYSLILSSFIFTLRSTLKATSNMLYLSGCNILFFSSSESNVVLIEDISQIPISLCTKSNNSSCVVSAGNAYSSEENE